MNSKKIFFFIILSFGVVSLFFGLQHRQFLKFESLYQSGAYQEAQNMLQNTQFLSAIDLHNLGNTYYKMFEEDIENLTLLESAVLYYSGSLQKEEQEDTRFNYEYTQKLLEALQSLFESEEEQSQQQKQESDENQSGTGSDGSPGSTTGSGAQESSPGETSLGIQNTGGVMYNARDEQYKMTENQTIESLTPEEQEYLDANLEALREEQKYNQQFYGKPSQDISSFQRAFESMMGGSQQKDW